MAAYSGIKRGSLTFNINGVLLSRSELKIIRIISRTNEWRKLLSGYLKKSSWQQKKMAVSAREKGARQPQQGEHYNEKWQAVELQQLLVDPCVVCVQQKDEKFDHFQSDRSQGLLDRGIHHIRGGCKGGHRGLEGAQVRQHRRNELCQILLLEVNVRHLAVRERYSNKE